MSNVIKLEFGGNAVRHSEDKFLCLTDMWRAAGSDLSKQPFEWIRSQQGKEFAEFVAENLVPGNSRDIIRASLQKLPEVRAKRCGHRPPTHLGEVTSCRQPLN
jgi:hypothetical protein